MAIASPINLDKVSGGMKSLNTGMGQLKKSADTVKTVTLNRTTIKRESIARNRMLSSMREEAVKRKDQESIIEASGIGGAFKRTGSVIVDSTKGFLGRLLDFTSSLLIGWLLYNLPTIMTAIEDLITRIRSLYGILTEFMSNIKDTFQNFGQLLFAVYQDIIRFDFTDQSKRVQSEMDDLNTNLELMHDQFMQGFDLLKTPLGEGPGEEPIPELNTDYTTSPGEGSGVSGYGTKEEQALLKTIRFAEGTAGPTGYSMFFGDKTGQSKYGDLTKLSANEVEKLVTKFLNDPQSRYGSGKSAAVGAYQIINITGKARSLGMDMNRKFDQSFQDEMALRLAASRGVTAEVLKREGLSDAVIKKLSPEWASFPGNTYGQPTKRSQDLKSTYQSSLSSPTTSTGASIPNQGSLPPLPRTNTLPGKQHYGAPRPGRKHAGVDFDISGPNAKFYSRIGGVVYGEQFKYGDDGWATDIYNQQLGVYERIAEAAKIVVRPGQIIKPGDLVAVGESGTGVIHYEIRKKVSGGFENTVDPIAFLNNQKPQSTQVSSPIPSGQISPTTQPGQNVPSIAQNKRAQQIMVVDDRQPSAPQQVSTSGRSQLQMLPVEDSLNSMIKNQILLELAYT